MSVYARLGRMSVCSGSSSQTPLTETRRRSLLFAGHKLGGQDPPGTSLHVGAAKGPGTQKPEDRRARGANWTSVNSGEASACFDCTYLENVKHTYIVLLLSLV